MSGRLERLAEKSAEVKPTKSSSKPNIVPRKEANKELEKAEWEANKYAYIGMRIPSPDCLVC
jgi:hypothetical protein